MNPFPKETRWSRVRIPYDPLIKIGCRSKIPALNIVLKVTLSLNENSFTIEVFNTKKDSPIDFNKSKNNVVKKPALGCGIKSKSRVTCSLRRFSISDSYLSHLSHKMKRITERTLYMGLKYETFALERRNQKLKGSEKKWMK